MRFRKLISVATLLAASLAANCVAQAATPEEIARQRTLDAQKGRAQQPPVRAQPQNRPDVRPQAQPQPQARPPVRSQPEARVMQPQQQPRVDVRPRDGGERRPEYRSGGGRDYRDGDRGDRVRRGVAVGAGIAIIGGVLGYNAYRGPSRDRVYDRCDRNFPDFDYDTGTFVNEDGDREICPYLID